MQQNNTNTIGHPEEPNTLGERGWGTRRVGSHRSLARSLSSRGTHWAVRGKLEATVHAAVRRKCTQDASGGPDAAPWP